MRFVLALIAALLIANVAAIDQRACPIIDVDQQVQPVDGQENTYRILFVNRDPIIDPEWVDMHIKVADKDQLNIRVASQPNSKQVLQDGVVVMPGEILRYYTTYSIAGTACDTQANEFVAPITGQQIVPQQQQIQQQLAQQQLAAQQYGQLYGQQYVSQQPIRSQYARQSRFGQQQLPLSQQLFGQTVFPQQQVRVPRSIYQQTGYDVMAALPNTRYYRQQQQMPSQQLYNQQYNVQQQQQYNQLCPSIMFDQRVQPMSSVYGDNVFQLSFLNRNYERLGLDYVDLHYQVNDEPEQNVRLGAGHARVMEKTGLMIQPGSHLTYWFTYAVNGVACDTERYEVNTPINTPNIYDQQQNIINQQIGQQQMPRFPQQQQPIVQQYGVSPYGMVAQQPIIGQQQQPIYQQLLNQQYRQQLINQQLTNQQQQQPFLNRQQRLQSLMQQYPQQQLFRTQQQQQPIFQQPIQSMDTQLCPALDFEQRVEKMVNNPSLYVVSFIDRDLANNVNYVDLHYRIDNSVEQNVRLATQLSATAAPQDKTVSQTGIYMQPGQKLRFYFTYQTADGVACDSQHYVADATY